MVFTREFSTGNVPLFRKWRNRRHHWKPGEVTPDAPVGIRDLRVGVACEILDQGRGCWHAQRRQLSMALNFSGT